MDFHRADIACTDVAGKISIISIHDGLMERLFVTLETLRT